MGILERVKSNLEYRAEDEITGGIMNAASKLLKRGDKTPKCPKCKKPVESGLKFCASCGAKLTVTCQKCNVDFPIGTKFCNQCGAVLKG